MPVSSPSFYPSSRMYDPLPPPNGNAAWMDNPDGLHEWRRPGQPCHVGRNVLLRLERQVVMGTSTAVVVIFELLTCFVFCQYSTCALLGLFRTCLLAGNARQRYTARRSRSCGKVPRMFPQRSAERQLTETLPCWPHGADLLLEAGVCCRVVCSLQTYPLKRRR